MGPLVGRLGRTKPARRSPAPRHGRRFTSREGSTGLSYREPRYTGLRSSTGFQTWLDFPVVRKNPCCCNIISFSSQRRGDRIFAEHSTATDGDLQPPKRDDREGFVTRTGLGLTIAREFARDLGGDLLLKKKRQPTKFHFILPRALRGCVPEGLVLKYRLNFLYLHRRRPRVLPSRCLRRCRPARA